MDGNVGGSKCRGWKCRFILWMGKCRVGGNVVGCHPLNLMSDEYPKSFIYEELFSSFSLLSH